MHRLAVLLLTVACATARQPPRAESSCTGTVGCGREQLVASDQALRQAIQKRGMAPAFAEVFQDDAKLLVEGKGVVSGKERVLAELGPMPPFAWTLAQRGRLQRRHAGLQLRVDGERPLRRHLAPAGRR